MGTISREAALAEADTYLEYLLKSGDPLVFDSAKRADGTIDTELLAAASLRAREKLADQIQSEGISLLHVLPPLSTGHIVSPPEATDDDFPSAVFADGTVGDG